MFRTCEEFQFSTFYLNENQFEMLCDPSISTFVVSVIFLIFIFMMNFCFLLNFRVGPLIKLNLKVYENGLRYINFNSLKTFNMFLYQIY